MIDQTRREREALARALEMLGFDPARLAADLLKGGAAQYCASLALDASRVTFDAARARALEPGLSPLGMAAAESWWRDARPDDGGGSLRFLPAREYDRSEEFEQLRLSRDEVARVTVTRSVAGDQR